MAALLAAPASKPLTAPALFVAEPVLAPKLALRSSLKAPAAAVLATLSACVMAPPMRWLANTTGEGVVAPVAALKPVARRLMTCRLAFCRTKAASTLVPSLAY